MRYGRGLALLLLLPPSSPPPTLLLLLLPRLPLLSAALRICSLLLAPMPACLPARLYALRLLRLHFTLQRLQLRLRLPLRLPLNDIPVWGYEALV